jgi:transcriptional regulator with GAF, ATPase, and Fis domain
MSRKGSEMTSGDCEFFRSVTRRICGSLDIGKAMYDTYCFLKECVPVEEVSYTLFDTEMGAIKFVAKADERGGRDLNMAPMRISTEIQQWLKRDIAFKECYLMNHPDEHPLSKVVSQFLEVDPHCSYLVMRLTIDGVFLGYFNLYCRGIHRYTEAHTKLMIGIREPLGAAMAHWRRYHEAMQLKALLEEDNSFLKAELNKRLEGEIIGSDFGLRGVMTRVRQVAGLDSVVLLLGETGTGKEVIANAIHRLSERSKGPFITVNCGAIPETLIDSELFGHEKGAFTGAVDTKRGRFERAHGGTIFLDEIGELPMNVQSRLLRVIQEREVERVGGKTPFKVNIRIIAATHRNLDEMVRTETFRQDLLFRLKVFPITIPPLRERPSDIPALAQYFVQKKCLDMGIKQLPSLSHGAIDRLLAYAWPGNVRELENLVEREIIINRMGPLEMNDINAGDASLMEYKMNNETIREEISDDDEPILPLDDVVAAHITKALERCDGQVEGKRGAAELLDIKPNPRHQTQYVEGSNEEARHRIRQTLSQTLLSLFATIPSECRIGNIVCSAHLFLNISFCSTLLNTMFNKMEGRSEMRLNSMITCIAVTGSLVGCSSPQMKVPADVLSMEADQIVVTGRKRASGAFVNESFELGRYAVKDVDRDWDTSSNLQVSGFSKENTTSGYSFMFATPSGDLSGSCLIEGSSKGMNLLGGLSMSKSVSKIGCACEGAGGKSEAVLNAGTDSKYEGTLTIRGGEYAVKAIYEAEGSLPTGDPSGYRVDGDTVVAAADVMHPGKIWIGKSLSDENREDMACLFAGLMLYTGKKKKD